MLIAIPRYAFNPTMISGAPNDPGVFALWENDEIIYYGHARGESATIQSCLQQHLIGAGGCPPGGKHYGGEISPTPPLREAQLLREFDREHKRLPRCNSRTP